jgi:hypothetical protein
MFLLREKRALSQPVGSNNRFLKKEKEAFMEFGPLEYVVIGLQEHSFAREILPKLLTIQEHGLIRVIDLLFVHKAVDGTITLQEINTLAGEKLQQYSSINEELMGILTTQDVEQLAREIPPDTMAVIVLLEHTWTLVLGNAIRRAHGVFFSGGTVSPEAVKQLGVELTAQEKQHA